MAAIAFEARNVLREAHRYDIGGLEKIERAAQRKLSPALSSNSQWAGGKGSTPFKNIGILFYNFDAFDVRR